MDGYVVNCEYGANRVDGKAEAAMQARIDAVCAEWQSVPESEDPLINMCSNIAFDLMYERKKWRFKTADERNTFLLRSEIGLYQAMPSALMMYRIACLHKQPHISLPGRDAYKVMWSARFQHSSGIYLDIYEWKGAVTLGVAQQDGRAVGSVSQITRTQRAAVLRLLNLLCEPNFTHPYDGLVAGSIA